MNRQSESNTAADNDAPLKGVLSGIASGAVTGLVGSAISKHIRATDAGFDNYRECRKAFTDVFKASDGKLETHKAQAISGTNAAIALDKVNSDVAMIAASATLAAVVVGGIVYLNTTNAKNNRKQSRPDSTISDAQAEVPFAQQKK